MKSQRIGRRLLVAAALCLATAMAAAQQYSMTVLGPFANLPYTGINNFGEVSAYNSTINTAVIYGAGGVTSLGLGHSAGTAINNAHQVVMWSSSSERSYLVSPPYVYLFDLGALGVGPGPGPRGTQTAMALAMNDSGTIVGESSITTAGTPQWHAFSYASGHMTDLGTLDPASYSMARSVNNLGQSVGESKNAGGYYRAFRVINGIMADIDPGNPAYDSSGYAINDSGQMVVLTNKAWHQVLVGKKLLWVAYRGPVWYTLLYNSNGSSVDVGNLGSTFGTFGVVMNNAGDIVGQAFVPNGDPHAFLYHAGAIIDLNSRTYRMAGWTLTMAQNINDLGQIVCQALGPDGVYQIVLLTPEPV